MSHKLKTYEFNEHLVCQKCLFCILNGNYVCKWNIACEHSPFKLCLLMDEAISYRSMPNTYINFWLFIYFFGFLKNLYVKWMIKFNCKFRSIIFFYWNLKKSTDIAYSCSILGFLLHFCYTNVCMAIVANAGLKNVSAKVYCSIFPHRHEE